MAASSSTESDKTSRIFAQYLAQDPLHCVDVGARGGAQGHFKRFQDIIRIDAIEPDEAACAQQAAIAAANEHWFPVGLAGHTGTATLYVLNKASGSSLYPPDDALMSTYSGESYGRVKTELPVPVLTFSDFIERHRRPLPNLVKLDTQGSELDILRGLSPSHWRAVLAVQSEVEFTPLYRGQPLFHDLDAHMRAQGFILFDLLPVRGYRYAKDRPHYYLRKHLNTARNRRDISCRLLAGDALYFRDPEQLLAEGDKVKLLKFFVILCIYRCYDEALWLAETLAERRLFAPVETAELIASVQAMAPPPGLRQRRDWLGKLARKWAKRLGVGQARVADYWLDRKWDF